MGSRAPVAGKSSQDPSPEDGVPDRSASAKSSVQRGLVGRIADALQVPPSALYNSPNAIDGQTSPTSADAFYNATDREGVELLRAYMCIRDPEEQRRILTLVQQTAKQS
jgi:hypothetical protein